MGLFKKLFGSSSDDDFVRRVRIEAFRKTAEAEKQALGDTPDTSLLYDVVLIDGHQRIYKASRIIEKYKGIRYTEASAMVESAPCVVAERVAYDEAASLCENFKQALAEVFIRRSEEAEETDEATSEDVENTPMEESASTPPPPPIPNTTAENEEVAVSSEEAVQNEIPTVAVETKDELATVREVPEKQTELLQIVTNLTLSKQNCTPQDDENQDVEPPMNAKVAEDSQENGTSEFEEKILLRGMIGSSFSECITIPEGFTRIGQKAFYNYKSLESITIPNSVCTIGEEAFYGCKNLEEITLPDSITTIKERAFGDCINLYTINMPANLEKIGERIFDGMMKLKDVDFSTCSKITKLNLNMFAYSIVIKCIYMPPHLEKIKGSSIAEITTVFLPPSFKKIREAAFSHCEQIYCYSENIESASALVTCCKKLFLRPDYIEAFITYLQAEGRNVEQIDDNEYQVDVSDVRFRNLTTILLPISPEKLYFYDD